MEPSTGTAWGLANGSDGPPTVDLVRRAKDGDKQAVNDLLHRYRERLRRIARIRLSAEMRRSIDGSDILQNAMMIAYQRLGSFEFRDDASLIHWLSRILENQIRDAAKYHHAQKRDIRRQSDLEATTATGVPGLGARLADTSAQTPSEVAENRELAEIYDAAVEELPDDQREAILLREYAGAEWDFVGEQLGRTPDAARELHRRAQIKLALLLKTRMK